ncbi:MULTISPECIES: hypothetical protein [Treponema]|uniref:HNH endonuclease 5 domain-containing protein n=1 Tax=Treponema denticola (strain ATCC 35405 / DSM 14222 / CIP 103919 / JCM 8153 / KCTC 15104) TaxID=243275 RepID=Q73P86_TREDE|nr:MULTISPECIES: hypothetical protein [Treponema]AAS11404.1 hypothetical protein TDE_0913 [Treponema denticola ATCC 35405]EMB33902.1 hypothetical protein HMPREF9721_02312 [Treponema denticola ATCC 35404]EMB36676.1 hypothetical protein HMPREF9735_02053 [Treponema denticola ATCC 33521]HCY94034.1 hypothetical protein [Treponema sp.]
MNSTNSFDDKLVLNIYTVDGDHQLLIDNNKAGFEFYLELMEVFADVDAVNHKINIKSPLCMSNEIKNRMFNFSQEKSKIKPEIQKLNKIIKDIPNNQFFIIIPYLLMDPLEILKIFEYLKCINNNASEEIFKEKIVKLEKDYTDSFAELEKKYEFIMFSTRIQNVIGEKDRTKRVCRYCGRSAADGTTFKEKAHAISESIGNKIFICTEECDACNSRFAGTIEKDFFELIKLYRTIYGSKGKNGIPTLHYRDGITIEYDKKKNCPIIRHRTDKPAVNEKGDLHLKLESDTNVNPMNIYRCLVKFALGLIDNSELSKFIKTVEWINNIKNDGSTINLPPVMCFLDRQNYFEQPEIVLYTRKTDDKKYPYLYAELKTCMFIFVFIVPFCLEDSTDFGNKKNFKVFWDLNKQYRLLNRKWVEYYLNTDLAQSFRYNFSILAGRDNSESNKDIDKQ